jgi:hypothetical protein
MFISCMSKYMAWNFHHNKKKVEIITNLYSFITKNRDLFDWKIKQKTNHFDIWSIWPFSHIEQIDLNMSNLTDGFFLLTTKWFFWLVKSDKILGNPKKLFKKIAQFVNIKL